MEITYEQAQKVADKLDLIIRIAERGRLGNARASLLEIGEEAKDVKESLFGKDTNGGDAA